MRTFLDYPEIDRNAALTAAAAGAVVVTANKRLARQLHEDYGRSTSKDGEVWERPAILPWEVWLENQVRFFDESPLLLSREQERHLWRQIVDDWAEGQGARGALLQRTGCAREAAEAWCLMHDYTVPWEALESDRSYETAAFRAYTTAFRQELAARQAIDTASQVVWLCKHLHSDNFQPPANLVLAGFFALTPAALTLLAALADSGCRVERLALPAATARRCYQKSFTDVKSETYAAAEFARRCLAKKHAARIAIIAHDFAGRRTELERIFTEVLAPARLLAPLSNHDLPFEMALGVPLADEPMIYDALLALELAKEKKDFGALSRLLRSPFFSPNPAAPVLEAALRADNAGPLDAEQLAYFAECRSATSVLAVTEQSSAAVTPATSLALALKKFIKVLRTSRYASPLAWSERFAQALAALGWPGGRTLSSREFQARAAFDEVLGTLATLGAVTSTWTLGQAFAAFRLLLAERIFQTASPKAPILITDPLPALGLTFDHLWWLGLNDGDWPPPARPNPFLPFALQRRYQIPGATADDKLQQAKALTSALFAAAPEGIASWPKRAADEDLLPSPLIAFLPELEPEPLSENFRTTIFAARQLENYCAESASAVSNGELKGGARLLADQSACPFKAFAIHRLDAEPLPVVCTGLNAMQRGELAHRCLQLLYEKTGGRVPAADEAKQAIAATVEAVLAAAGRKMLVLNEPKMATVECRRLQKLLADWLNIEYARPAKFRVAAMEEKRQVAVGPFTFHVRIDRIDETAAGRILIDYKSGAKKPKAWTGERPEEPQLPLYALDEGGALAAVCYANLKPGELGYLGIARQENIIPGAKLLEKSDLRKQAADWNALLATWRRVLGTLAAEYAAGHAAVAPRDEQVCRYCGLQALCRIDERRGPSGELAALEAATANLETNGKDEA